MKRLIYSLILLSFVSIEICCQNNTFQLNGKIDTQYNGNQIMLFTFRQDTILSVDTTIIKNGYFFFQGKEYLDDFSLLSVGNYPDEVNFLDVILEKGQIEVSMDNKTVKGGYLSDLYRSYSDSVKVYQKQIEILYEEQGNQKVIEGTPIYNKFVEEGIFTVNFKRKNISNIVGKTFFREETGKRASEFYAYGPEKSFQMVLDAADEKYKEEPWIKEYLQRLEKRKEKEVLRNNSIGKQYTDFEFKNPEGETKKLSDYIGKSEYLFIDFWASWCGPCIADIPNLKKVYDEYKEKGLEIIGISLDDTQSAWEKGLSKINAPWIHLCDFKGSRSKLTETYGIYGIPYGILLNKEGYIVNVNLGGESLGILLQNMMKKK